VSTSCPRKYLVRTGGGKPGCDQLQLLLKKLGADFGASKDWVEQTAPRRGKSRGAKV